MHGFAGKVLELLGYFDDGKFIGFTRSNPKCSEVWNFITQQLKLETLKKQDQKIDKLKEGLKVLDKKLGNILETLEKRLQTFSFERKLNNNSSSPETLGHYVKIASYIQDSGEMKEFETKLGNLHAVTSKKLFSPFAFICASSGTGKTNAAFALTSPFLYFLYYPDSNQTIYQIFREESEHLLAILKEDLENYKDGVRLEDVLKATKQFKVVGFIVEFLKQVGSEFYQSGKSKNPVEIQSSIQSLTYRAMSIEEARKVLEELHKTLKMDDLLFPVIFDECAFTKNQIPGGQNERTNLELERPFMLLRSVVRCILCPPIFMGTNAEAANFLGFNTGVGSGGKSDDPWCLVLHRPPGLSPKLVESVIKNLLQQRRSWSSRSKAQFPSEDVLAFIGKYLQKERPLFLHYAVDYIGHFFGDGQYTSSDQQFLALLCEDILDQFIERKGDHDWVNRGQFAYLASYSWCNQSFLKKQHFETDLYINRHMGYLNAKPDPELNARSKISYTTLTTRPLSDYTYARLNFYGNEKFVISSYFDDFKSMPFSGLICLGITADNQSILVEANSFQGLRKKRTRQGNRQKIVKRHISGTRRISMILAIFKGFDPVRSNILHWRISSSGFILELSLFAATLLASRACGFSGCDLPIFLKYLLREFDYGAAFGDGVKPPEVKLDRTFLAQFRSLKIPFLPAMAIDNWNNNFVKDLQDVFGPDQLNLGLVFPSIDNSPADIVVKGWPDKKVVLAGECKLYRKNIDAGTLQERVINKFKKYPECRLFLAVAPDFADVRDRVFDGGFCVWTFSRDQSGKLEQIPLTDSQPKNSSRHVLLLELSTLSSRVDETFEDIMKSFHKA